MNEFDEQKSRTNRNQRGLQCLDSSSTVFKCSLGYVSISSYVQCSRGESSRSTMYVSRRQSLLGLFRKIRQLP